MPFADHQGVRIHYETVGQGPPLIMQYGQYFPLDVWHEYGYVNALQSDCRLVLVDARGHGDSDKPHDPAAYRMELMMGDIIAVLDDLGLDKAHYMGYSSGGYLGFVLAKYMPERFDSFILGGTHPYPSPDPDQSAAWHAGQVGKFERLTTAEFVADLEGFLASLGFPPLSSRMHSSLLKHDLRALIAWHRAVDQDVPACDGTLGAIAVPCLLYAGGSSDECDDARRTAGEIPGAAFVEIPHGAHLEGGTWIDALRPHILRMVKGT